MNQTSDRNKKKRHRARVLVIAAVALTASAVLAVLLFIICGEWSDSKNDSVQSNETVTLAIGAPKTVEQGIEAPLTIKATNNFSRKLNLVVKIALAGLTIDPNRQSVQGLQALASADLAKFGAIYETGSGVTWRIGQIAPGANQNINLKAQVAGAAGGQASLKVQAYSAQETSRRCGFLWVARCDIQVGETPLEWKEVAALVTPQSQSGNKLTLGKGYNLVSLPYVWQGEQLATFWGQFVSPKAWRIEPVSNSWHNLTDANYSSEIKPGNGFWLYHPDGGAVALPKANTLDMSQKVEVLLATGWNQIGNPYKERIRWSGDQIIVKRAGAEDLSLQGAIDAGIITQVLSISGAVPEVGDLSAPAYTPIVPGRYLPAFTGLFLESSSSATLVFPGKILLAPGELLSSTEKAKILGWINKNGLDLCGNQPSGGTSSNPLLSAETGEVLDQYDCVILKHPDRPWNK